MRKTEVRPGHRLTCVMIVAVGLSLGVGLRVRPAVAGHVVDAGERRPVETTTYETASEDIATEEVADPCAESPSRDPEVPALWKLGRGFHNLVFGLPAEVVRNPAIEILKADTVFGVGAGAFEGVLIGVGKGFWRLGAGFLDIVTFPSPMAPWYDCRVLPEYPF